MNTTNLPNQQDPITRSLPESEVEPDHGAANGGKRILIADDDLSVRHTLARVLEGENYSVVLAKNGHQAVFMFLHALPDLVLLDINMPDQDGWKAFESMEKSRPLVPVIVITARPHQYEHAMKLGIDALMEKPLNLPFLLTTIAGLLAETEPERLRRLTNPDFKTLRDQTFEPKQ